MATFIVKSLFSFVVIAALWGPAGTWLGTQHGSGLSCKADFSACRVAGKVIPLVDRSSVLGGIAAEARHDPAGKLIVAVRQAAGEALRGAHGAGRQEK